MKAKYAIFASLVVTISLIFILGVILVLDLHYHNKYLETSGLNYKGYRGKVVGKKQQNEIRLAVLGGSVAMGYGIRYDQALPAQLEEQLQAYGDSLGWNKKITVLNLAYNVEGAYNFEYNLKDFAYLDYDYVLFFSGYNDLGVGNAKMFRHANPIFRTFGYMPILSLIVRDKIVAIKSGNQLKEHYEGRRVVFKPKPKDRLTILTLESALKSYNKLENIFDRLKKINDIDFDMERIKTDKWSWYKHFMKKAIDFSLAQEKKVIVMTPPYHNQAHREQQDSLKKMVLEAYRDEEDLLYKDLGESLPVVEDKELSFDGMHLTAKGSQIMASIITQEIGDYICKRGAE